MSEEEIARIEGDERSRLIGLYRETRAQVFLDCARLLRRPGADADLADLLAPDPPREGRPAYVGDHYKVAEMHLLIRRGEVPSLAAAATALANREMGHSPEATAARLRRKAREMPEAKRCADAMMQAEREHKASLERVEAIRIQFIEDEQNSRC